MSIQAKKKLLLKKYLFRYTYSKKSGCEDDGPTMLRGLFDKYNPITKLGVSMLKISLSGFKLTYHKQCVPRMLDEMLVAFNFFITEGYDDLMPEIFNYLPTSDNAYFLDFVKKKRDNREEHQLEDDVDMLINACTKNTTTSLSRDLLRAGNHEDDSEYKCIALLTKILPTVLAAAAQQPPNTPYNGQPCNSCKSLHANFRNIYPAIFACAGLKMTETTCYLCHWNAHHNNRKGMHFSHPQKVMNNLWKGKGNTPRIERISSKDIHIQAIRHL